MVQIALQRFLGSAAKAAASADYLERTSKLLPSLRSAAGVLEFCAENPRQLSRRQLPETEPKIAALLARLVLADIQQVAVLRAIKTGTAPRAIARICFGLSSKSKQLFLPESSLIFCQKTYCARIRMQLHR